MDVNRFLKKIDRVLGLRAMHLEEYFPEIMKVLTEDTLDTFSQYFPYVYEYEQSLQSQTPEKTVEHEYIYYINDPYLLKNQVNILSVESVTGTNIFTDYNNTPATFNVYDMIQYGAISSVRSQLGMSYKAFKFLPPNRLKLKGYNGYETVRVILKIPYPNLGSVYPSLREQFERLALLDIKITIYSELKHWDKLDTADGTIDLKIDDWSNAENERKELLDNWANKAITAQALGSNKIYHYE